MIGKVPGIWVCYTPCLCSSTTVFVHVHAYGNVSVKLVVSMVFSLLRMPCFKVLYVQGRVKVVGVGVSVLLTSKFPP